MWSDRMHAAHAVRQKPDGTVCMLSCRAAAAAYHGLRSAHEVLMLLRAPSIHCVGVYAEHLAVSIHCVFCRRGRRGPARERSGQQLIFATHCACQNKAQDPLATICRSSDVSVQLGSIIQSFEDAKI